MSAVLLLIMGKNINITSSSRFDFHIRFRQKSWREFAKENAINTHEGTQSRDHLNRENQFIFDENDLWTSLMDYRDISSLFLDQTESES